MSIVRMECLNVSAVAIGGAFAFALIATSCVATSQVIPDAQVNGSDAVARADACQSLRQLKIDNGEVTGADRISKGEAVAAGEGKTVNAGTDACRVRVQVRPAPGSDIGVEVWLPRDWNGKLYGIGGAGFDGALSPGSVPMFIKSADQGYAVVATDVGHQPGASLESWVHRQPSRVIDFGHRGVHLAAVVAKQVVATYYGAPAKRSYFMGCSNGGREGMMLATRYPGDYDGIIAGAPAMRYLEVLTQMIWFHDAVHGPGGADTLGSKLGLVNRAILAKCDKLDGVGDGILENPLECNFDPAELRCKATTTDDCLTDAEVSAFKKIYGGPRLRSGKQVSVGPAVGSEEGAAGWGGWVVPDKTAWFGQEFYRWLAFDDPDWKVENFDIDRDYPRAFERIAPIVNANDPNLSAFAKKGGKLILYQGWYDPGITPGETIKYYDEVRRRLGPATDDHVRLFMVPGMAHCADGPGATSFDMLAALENWSERGEAPERVIAERPKSDPPFTRPLCPWPKTARYTGSGPTNDAASFKCE